jgi:hypothetical protein
MWQTSLANNTQPTPGMVLPTKTLNRCVRIHLNRLMLFSVNVGNTLLLSSYLINDLDMAEATDVPFVAPAGLALMGRNGRPDKINMTASTSSIPS